MSDTLDGLWQDALIMTPSQHTCAQVKTFQVEAGLLWGKAAPNPHHNKGRDSQRHENAHRSNSGGTYL